MRTKNGNKRKALHAADYEGLSEQKYRDHVGKKQLGGKIESSPDRLPAEKALVASEIRFRRLYESAQDGILILEGKEGRIIEANPFIINFLEYGEKELLGKELWQIGLFEDEKKSQAAFDELQRKGYVRYEDLPLKTKSGKTQEVEFVSNAYESDNERVIQCNIRDITARKAHEDVLAAAHELLKKAVIEQATTQVAMKQSMKELSDRNLEFSLLSEMADSIQSCVLLEEAYRVVARFSVQFFPETQGVLYTTKLGGNGVGLAIAWGGTISGDNEFSPNECVGLRRARVHASNKDNADKSSSNLTCQHLEQPPPAYYLCAPMIAYGEIQGVLHLRGLEAKPGSAEKPPNPFDKSKFALAGTIADYVALALANLKLREALRQQSDHDPVTGLYSRRYMKEALDRELRCAIRDQRPLGIIMLDIDHFKKLNDSFGHDAGDALLSALGNFLKAKIRGNDIACRYGGEEFLIILPRIPLNECQTRAETLLEEIKCLEVKHAGQTLPRLSISAGISGYPDHGDLLDDLLKVADTALYSAKAAGRDCVVVGEKTAVATILVGI